MVKRIPFILLLSLFSASALADTQRANYANSSTRAEATGFFSGAIAGGLVGGPPGVIIGGAIGALLGEGQHSRTTVKDLQADLFESQLEFAAMQQETLALRREYQLAQAKLRQAKSATARLLPANLNIQSADACCNNTVLSLHFRTGSSAIENHYREELQSLVNIARQMPRARVNITGYADRNGDSDLNLQLSRERSNAVKQFFNSKGIVSSAIQTVAYGETKPLQSTQSPESDFFDRRVIVRLIDSSKQLLTQTPDGE